VIIPTNNPLYAVIQTAHDLGAQEMIMGASNKYTADEQIEQIAFYWIDVHGGRPTPLTVRILSRRRDVYFDLAGGNRIPKISERLARSVAELRAAGVGIGRVLLVHFDTAESSDLFRGVLTMLDPQVVLTIVPITPQRRAPEQCPWVQLNLQRAAQLRRPVRAGTPGNRRAHGRDRGPGPQESLRPGGDRHAGRGGDRHAAPDRRQGHRPRRALPGLPGQLAGNSAGDGRGGGGCRRGVEDAGILHCRGLSAILIVARKTEWLEARTLLARFSRRSITCDGYGWRCRPGCWPYRSVWGC